MVFVTASGGNSLRTDFGFGGLTDIDSTIIAKTSGSLIIEVEGLRYSFTGTNVRYNSNGEPVSGTITGMELSRDGNILLNIDGFSVSATQFYLATYVPDNPLRLVLAGNDEYRGSPLNDLIEDSQGHNIFWGGDGRDIIAGSSGNDHIYGQSPAGGPDGDDILNGGGGSDYIQGNAGDDQIGGGPGSDRLNGGQGADSIYADDGNDTVNGNRGNDNISGVHGNDLLRGGQGDDQIHGGDGDDVIMGDLGIDRLYGDSGRDTFVFGPGSSPIASDDTLLDKVFDFEDGDRFALGFVPNALLIERSPPSGNGFIGDALAAADAMFSQHPGSKEVAVVYSTYGAFLVWDSHGGEVIDSIVYLALSSFKHDYVLSEFV